MDKDIKILGLVFGCLIILFFISGNITGNIAWPWIRRAVEEQPTSLKYVKPAEEVKPQQVETTQFKTAPISQCSNILTKDQCNTLCGRYYTDVVYDVPVIAGPTTTKCTDSDGGFNPYVAGTCKDIKGEYSDKCTSNTYMTEYCCGSDNLCVARGVSCPSASREWNGLGSCWPGMYKPGVAMCYGPKKPPEENEPFPPCDKASTK